MDVLEIGPGSGLFSFPIAQAVTSGRLTCVDIAPELVDALEKRAGELGIGNMTCIAADARKLPLPENSVDVAFMATVLGEIPDKVGVLSEIRRVLRPGGRLVVNEMMLDPDYLLPSTVRRLAARAGLRETDRAGSFLTRSEKKTCGCIRKKLPTPCARLEGIYWEMENRYGAMGEEAGQ